MLKKTELTMLKLLLTFNPKKNYSHPKMAIPKRSTTQDKTFPDRQFRIIPYHLKWKILKLCSASKISRLSMWQMKIIKSIIISTWTIILRIMRIPFPFCLSRINFKVWGRIWSAVKLRVELSKKDRHSWIMTHLNPW